MQILALETECIKHFADFAMLPFVPRTVNDCDGDKHFFCRNNI